MAKDTTWAITALTSRNGNQFLLTLHIHVIFLYNSVDSVDPRADSRLRDRSLHDAGAGSNYLVDLGLAEKSPGNWQ